MPSKMEFNTFARLTSAKKEVDANHMDYKSGASFSGPLDGRKRVGRGVFVWPNGDRYSGDYVDNQRHGKGEQLWSDGSKFTGDFVHDTRHGLGEHFWQEGESFKGSYFKDHRHGEGTYTWPDGSNFVGTFYKNKKDGYGVFKFSSGNEFQGLYISDEREGPGVLSYPDGKQDVGLWRKERLVKLCSPIEGAFTMADHTDFEYDPDEHIISLTVVDLRNPMAEGAFSVQREDLRSDSASEDSLRASMDKLTCTNFTTNFDIFQPSMPESVDLNTLTYDREEYDCAFFGSGGDNDNEDSGAQGQTLTALNNTPSLIQMQLHVLKHQKRESTINYPVNDLIHGDRQPFAGKGPIELMSEELISAAASGGYDTVHSLLSKGAVNVNVADKNGHISLIAAAVHMHCEIISCLLDNGADVNKLNDEGLSALAACNVLFYPIDSFKYNIAERYLPVPPGEERMEMRLVGDSSLSARVGQGEPPPGNVGQSTVVDAGSTNHGAAPRKKPSVVGEGDFYDIPSPSKDGEIEEGVDGLIPEWDPDNDSVEERRSVKNAESLTGKELGEESIGQMSPLNELDTDQSLVDFGLKITEEMIERSATAMSKNPRVVSRGISKQEDNLDESRRRAISKAEHSNMEATIRLLLKRGADPNASSVPMPVLFFAIKAADVDAVSILLEKKASTEARLSSDKEGLTPLHIASGIRGQEGVDITNLLLQAGANPNARALDNDLDQHAEDLSPLDRSSKLKPGLDDSVFHYLQELEVTGDHNGGRSPLHIACDRDDDYELSRQVVNLLLEHEGNPNVLCRGQSPLSLAIASGNDLAIDELLRCNANASLPLGQSIGSALCVTANTQYEFRRTPQQRIALIDKLVNAGANILAPVAVGAKRQMGTAVDYAYWMFNQDRRIAHMPYHALTHAERDTYNARRKLLSHLGEILREASVRREKERLEQEEMEGLRSISPSHGFLYTGAGAKNSDLSMGRSQSPPRLSSSGGAQEGGKQVAFESITKDNSGMTLPLVDKEGEMAISGEGSGLMVLDASKDGGDQARAQRVMKHASRSFIRKPLFRYCYECGRSIGVRLSACTRCKEVYYCSKACKIKAWNARHKEECMRLGGRSRSPSPTFHNNSNSTLDSTQGSNSKGHAGSGPDSKGQSGGSGSGAKGQMGGGAGSNGGKGQGGSFAKGQGKAVNSKVKGQQGSGAGTNGKGQAMAGKGSKGGVGVGGKGQAGDKGSKGKGQPEGGDNRLNGQTSGRDVITNGMRPECTDNYSYN